jgi:hypothetical protein
MGPELRMALESFERICKLERQLEQTRDSLQVRVAQIPKSEISEYLRESVVIENRYSGYTVTPKRGR